jgi:hypothetical protein
MHVMVFTSMLIAFAAFLRKANVCASSTSITHVQRALLRQDVQVDLQRYCLAGYPAVHEECPVRGKLCTAWWWLASGATPWIPCIGGLSI